MLYCWWISQRSFLIWSFRWDLRPRNHPLTPTTELLALYILSTDQMRFVNRMATESSEHDKLLLLNNLSCPVSFQSATLPVRMRGSSAPSSFLQEKMEELQLNKDKRKEPDWTQVHAQDRKKNLHRYLVLGNRLCKHPEHLFHYIKQRLNCAHAFYRCINVTKTWVGPSWFQLRLQSHVGREQDREIITSIHCQYWWILL